MMPGALYLCPLCRDEPLEQPDPDNEELVCPRCGAVYANPELRKLERLTEGRQLSSPGLVDRGLGTDQKKIIRTFQGLGRKAQDKDPQCFRPDGFMLTLTDIWDGRSDESFWIPFTQKMKDKGIPHEKIALICAVVRQEMKHLDRKRSQELADILRRFGIE